MNKAVLLKIVNPLLALSFITQASTGLLMEQAMEAIEETHEINGYILMVLTLAHIYLNWAWIKANVFKRPAKKTA